MVTLSEKIISWYLHTRFQSSMLCPNFMTLYEKGRYHLLKEQEQLYS